MYNIFLKLHCKVKFKIQKSAKKKYKHLKKKLLQCLFKFKILLIISQKREEQIDQNKVKLSYIYNEIYNLTRNKIELNRKTNIKKSRINSGTMIFVKYFQ